MPAVESSILIRCTPEQAFDLSQDYGLRLKWDPFLSDLKFLDGATEAAVGVRTWVRSRRGMEMVSEYVAIDRPHVVAIKMVEVDANTRATRMFEQFGGSWRFKDADDGLTRVTMRYTFAISRRGIWKWIGWAAQPIARRLFRRDVRGRLEGLKRGIETLQLLPAPRG